MSFHYLIDGYNLLYALPQMLPGTWERKRAQLISFLRDKRPHGNNALTIVFDSREGSGDQKREGYFTVIFTAGESADDRISHMVRASRHRRSLVVVSNDQGIRLLIKGTGARFVSATEFLKNARQTKTHDPCYFAPYDGAHITEELRKTWLAHDG